MSKIDHISNSMINTYVECPHKFKLMYIDKLGKNEDIPSFFKLGTLVHGILEKYYSNEELFNDDDGAKKALDMYVEEMGINVPYDIYEEAIDMATAYITNNEKIKPDAVELEINEMFDGVNVPVIGYIDKITVNDDYVHIVDYKTSNMIYSNADLDKNLQWVFYAVFALKHFERDIYFTFDFVRHDSKITLYVRYNGNAEGVMPIVREYTVEDVNDRWDYIKHTYRSMVREGAKYDARMGTQCVYCPVKRWCDTFINSNADNVYDGDNIDKMIEEYNRLNAIEKGAKAEREKLGKKILTMMDAGVKSDEYDVRVTSRKNKVRPVKLILEKLPVDELINVVSIKESGLKKLPEDILKEIEEKTIIYNGKPYISKIVKRGD